MAPRSAPVPTSLALRVVDPSVAAPPADHRVAGVYWLAVQRIRLGIGVNDLARRMGASAGHLSNVENGARDASASFLARYRSALLAVCDEALSLADAEHGSARVGREWLRAVRVELATLNVAGEVAA